MVNKIYSENFVYRERLIDISIAKKIMIYPKYMIVNKTEKYIIYNQKENQRQIVRSRANDFLMGKPEQNDKIKFKYEYEIKDKDIKVEYNESELFDLNTLGLSGVITMDFKKKTSISRGDQRAVSD